MQRRRICDLATTPEPQYTAAIFTSVRTDGDHGHDDTAVRMFALAHEQPGFLGVDSARDTIGITVSCWVDDEAAHAWMKVAEHLMAQRLGAERWYSRYRVRIATVPREYSRPMTDDAFDPYALLAASKLGVLATIKSDGRAKTKNLRRDPRATLEVTGPDGLSWATAEGTATLLGPGSDANAPAVDALVEYYRSAAGEHPDWNEYRAVMVSDRRVLVRMTVDRVYGQRIG